MRLPRVRLTVSLRTLLLLILVFGLWLGWKESRARDQRRAVAEVNKYNGHVYYDYEYANGKKLSMPGSRAPVWLRRIFGDEYFQEVRSVIYVDQPISDATLAPLDNLGGIEELGFLSRMGHHSLPEVKPPPGLEGLTEAGLARLGELTRLRRLDIHEHHPMEEGEHYLRGSMLNRLSRAHGLEELRLFQTGMTDQGMPPLRAMPHLRELDLWCNRLTGTFLAPIRGSASLRVLALRYNPVSDAGLDHIGTLTNLRELDLSNTDVDDAGVSHLTALTNLTELGLGSTKVTDACLVYLSGMTRLEGLNLEECRITGRGLDALRTLTGLKVLRLGGSSMDDAGLATVGRMTSLTVLELYRTSVTDSGLAHLRTLKRLEKLSLSVTKVTDAGVERLKKELPMIAELDHWK